MKEYLLPSTSSFTTQQDRIVGVLLPLLLHRPCAQCAFLLKTAAFPLQQNLLPEHSVSVPQRKLNCHDIHDPKQKFRS